MARFFFKILIPYLWCMAINGLNCMLSGRHLRRFNGVDYSSGNYDVMTFFECIVNWAGSHPIFFLFFLFLIVHEDICEWQVSTNAFYSSWSRSFIQRMERTFFNFFSNGRLRCKMCMNTTFFFLSGSHNCFEQRRAIIC